jgi:farnesyl-diphosphate farnesyltransferase
MIETRIIDKKKINNQQFQYELLQGVSRTFALTIPQLPGDLKEVVSNAYLLCRALDTIEDEPELTYADKKKFSDWFTDVVDKNADAQLFSEALTPLLSAGTIPMEHELIREIDRVVNITHNYSKEYQEVLSRCIGIMSEGMIFYQKLENSGGLKNLKELDDYCYFVAGVVGEMLTDLFCLHLPEALSSKREDMMKLSNSFGQGLQMTNILKDIWDDQSRGVCWLPNDVFEHYGYDLALLQKGQINGDYQKGLSHMIGIAHTHLDRAFKYTLMIPPEEAGIRNFLLWAIFMALYTLKKIYKNIDATDSEKWKINRKSVKQIVVISKLTARHDFLLKSFFKLTSRGLPKNPIIFAR